MIDRKLSSLVAAVLIAGCAGSTPDAADPEAAARDALAAIHADYVTHFNLHHAGAVADLMADSAVFLGADGSVDFGRGALVAGLEETMAASPTLSLTQAETIVLGNRAFTRGSYTLGMTPPGGAAITLSGNYLTQFVGDSTGWKIGGVLTNYDAPPPEGLPRDTTTMEPPPEAGTMGELVTAFTQHYNQGHAPQVAALFTDSAVAMFMDSPVVTGRAAIEAHLARLMAEGSPQMAVHDVYTEPVGDGWAWDAGWWEAQVGGVAARSGAYVLLARRGDDGAWKIHWFAGNGGPVATR